MWNLLYFLFVSRTYSCDQCSFTSRSAKEHLYHCRDEHGIGGPIFECDLCDYASRFNQKVSRHMSVHKRPTFHQPQVKNENAGKSFKDVALTAPVSGDMTSSFKMRVKPLKLKLMKNKNKTTSFQISSKIEDHTLVSFCYALLLVRF